MLISQMFTDIKANLWWVWILQVLQRLRCFLMFDCTLFHVVVDWSYGCPPAGYSLWDVPVRTNR